MKKSLFSVAAAASVALAGGLLLVGQASAVDAIKKHGNAPRLAGTLKAITQNDVTIEVQGRAEKVPVTDVDAIEFDGEPSELKLARGSIRTGGDKNALQFLDKIDATKITNKGIKQDLAFYKAMAHGRSALRGEGDINKAGADLFTFIGANADSYHYYAAQELMGDLLVANNKIDDAIKVYGVLDASPFDEYKMRAGVAVGRALMTKKDFPGALAAFDKVLGLPFNPMTQKGTSAESQRFAAILGKAQCQANTGGYDEAIKELEGTIIPNLNPEEARLQAAAYNTLGNCYNQKPDGKKAALLAFLHVDVLYNTVPAEHAEALWNLSNLWIDIGKNERGQECLNKLNRLYPASPWVTKRRPT
jgi:tetratricopeptide (TPR) repeat protein